MNLMHAVVTLLCVCVGQMVALAQLKAKHETFHFSSQQALSCLIQVRKVLSFVSEEQEFC